MSIFNDNPLPWSVRKDGVKHFEDCGAILDAEGREILWLGDGEHYYPTNGFANEGVLEAIIEAMNEERA